MDSSKQKNQGVSSTGAGQGERPCSGAGSRGVGGGHAEINFETNRVTLQANQPDLSLIARRNLRPKLQKPIDKAPSQLQHQNLKGNICRLTAQSGKSSPFVMQVALLEYLTQCFNTRCLELFHLPPALRASLSFSTPSVEQSLHDHILKSDDLGLGIDWSNVKTLALKA